MSTNQVEVVQSFIRRYINKAIREHFSDVSGLDEGSLNLSVPRQAIKLVCLHQDKDPIMLTILRLLIYWVEARGLFNEIIYGIPAQNFHETVIFKPQIALYWREDKDDAKAANRYPARARYTVRFKKNVTTRTDIDRIRIKINNIFNKPTTHKFWKGREKFSYRDKILGYEFIITARDESEARDVINALLEIQGDQPLVEKYLTRSTSDRNWNERETVRVDGEVHEKPKPRPIALVKFTHAELKVHGMTQDILLTDNQGLRVPAGVDN